jgi:hypothetical protein
MTVANPWQWFVSVRTFSNSLENALTVAALRYWPWELVVDTPIKKDGANPQSPIGSPGAVKK